MSRQAGIGLLEVLLALSLGSLLLLGASRLFVAASLSWQAQAVAARMQEDGRQALQRMVTSIRMAGMFGCLRHDSIKFFNPADAAVFASPVQLTQGADGRQQRLSLISADSAHATGQPEWTLVTDCRTQATVHADVHAPPAGQFAVPFRRQEYWLVGNQLRVRTGRSVGTLVDGVSELQFELLRDRELDVSGVRLGLTLVDPQGRVKPQTFRISIALGNPVSGS